MAGLKPIILAFRAWSSVISDLRIFDIGVLDSRIDPVGCPGTFTPTVLPTLEARFVIDSAPGDNPLYIDNSVCDVLSRFLVIEDGFEVPMSPLSCSDCSKARSCLTKPKFGFAFDRFN